MRDMKQDIIHNIIHNAGSMDNLIRVRQSWESDDDYMDRIYTDAHNLFMDAVEELDLCGLDDEDVAPYDDIREETICEIMNLLIGHIQ